MTSRRLQAVLHNLLGTYTSRYSSHEGYWLFGFLVADLDVLEIELLAASHAPLDGPIEVAAALAMQRFREQLAKARFNLARLAHARLRLERLPGEAHGPVGTLFCPGSMVRFTVTAGTSLDSRFEATRVVFVAPHDPRHEQRSGL